MVCDTYLADYPQYVPGVVSDLADGNRPRWMLLTCRKRAQGSSALNGHPVEYAFDENIRDWWSARTGDPGEWLQVDMGKPCRVDAIQVNFADEGAIAKHRLTNDGYGYTLALSMDGKTWRTVIDRTTDRRDASDDYVQLNAPVRARFARITNAHMAASAKFSISGLRLFGQGSGAPPDAVTGVHVQRDPTDGRPADISWKPVPRTDGYIVPYGIARNELFSNCRVYGTDSLHIHSLDDGTHYFFTVDAFNDSGLTKGTEVTGG